MKINPHYLLAKRRAEHNAVRFGHPHLEYPTIARKGKPMPVELDAPPPPAQSLPPEIPGWNWDTAVLVVCAVAMVSLFFIEI